MNREESYESKNEMDVYLQKIASYSLLSADKEKELGRIIQKGNGQTRNEAIKELVESNLRLVVFIIKKDYLNHIDGKTTSFDLIQAGNEGLIKAAEGYDPMNHDNKFSTYASWWIRQKIQITIEQQKEIPIRNERCWTMLNQLKKIKYDYFEKNSCWPSPEWIAEKMVISVEKVNQLLRIPQMIISLEKPFRDDSDSKLGDFIPDKNYLNPEQAAQFNELKELTSKIIASLKPRQEKVIRMWTGKGERDYHNLQEIADYFNVTRERTRQIKEEAFRKLNRPKHRKILEDFIE